MFNVQECDAQFEDIKQIGDDNLNYHERTLYVMRKDGHYDVIYKPKEMKFQIDSYKHENKESRVENS